MKTKSYDYAFPVSADILEKEALGHFNNAGQSSPFGLSKREYFASLAMQSYLNNSSLRLIGFKDRIRLFLGIMPKKVSIEINGKNISDACVDIADKLIDALNK